MAIIRRRRKYKFRIVALLLIILLGVGAFYTDGQIRPVIKGYCETDARRQVTNFANKSLNEILKKNPVDYSELAEITYNEGKVSSVQINSAKMNILETDLINKISKEADKHSNFNVYIPWGTLSRVDYLVGRGPKLHISMEMTGNLTAHAKSDFVSAGINQTKHEIILEIEFEMYFIAPWFRAHNSVVTEYIIAETVIVGEVPDAYTVVDEEPGDDTAGLIFDYGTQN